MKTILKYFLYLRWSLLEEIFLLFDDLIWFDFKIFHLFPWYHLLIMKTHDLKH